MLRLHTSPDAGSLIGALAGVLAEAPPDPLAPEVIAVPTRGIERWIAQELSLRLGGVAANISFPSPGRVVAEAVAAAHGGDHPGDPWRAEALVWPVLAALDESVDEPWMAVPAHFVRSGGGGVGRRLSAARTIARLFASYDVQRPDLIQAWAAGTDAGAEGETLAWQPRFWRLVRARIGVPSPAEALDRTVEAIASGSVQLDLPDRLSVYGLTALPTGHLRVLEAIATDREVHLFVLQPSPALWARLAPALAGAAANPIPTRSSDPTAAAPVNPLLASWGRDARELQVLLAHTLGPVETAPAVLPDPEPVSLLARLQAGVRADRAPDRSHVLDPADRSVQIHSCHGPARQVEVLRDAILHLLAADPTLEPRDVVVMCPDVETFAPLIEAAFHPDGEAAGIPDLRVRIADRAPVAANPLAELAVELIDLAGSRVTASQVVDLLSRPPVRARFRLSDDLLDAAGDLVPSMNVSWGINAAHRARMGLPDRPERTWAEGLERLLAGVAFSDREVEVVAGRLPVAGLEGTTELEAVGRLAEAVARLGRVVEAMSGPLPARQWRETLRQAVALLGDAEPGADWQWRSLDDRLDSVFDGAGDQPITRAGVSVLLEPLRQGRPTRSQHRTGDLTVCTLVPMRSVPHRVVCLLGMDDGRFPRQPGASGDDLLAAEPRVGDRDPASEDRQLLLDALLAARDHLVVTYSGHHETTNAPRPPCVPVAELLDTIDATAVTAAGEPAGDAVLVEHPLQPFDRRNFEAGRLMGPGPWGFDRDMLAGAVASPSPAPPDPGPPTWPPPDPVEELTLDALRRFLEHPVRAFVESRLGFRHPDGPRETDDTLPVELDALAAWSVGDRRLSGLLAGVPEAELDAAERGRGSLPPGRLGDRALDSIAARAAAVAEAVAGSGLTLPAAGTLPVDLRPAGGVRLVGVVGDLAGTDIALTRYGRIRAKDLLAGYLRLLACVATDPEAPWRVVAVGVSKDEPQEEVMVPPGPPGEDRRRWALDGLACLVDLYRRGMAEPIPLFLETSHTCVRHPTKPAWWRSDWEGRWPREGEQADPHHLTAFGGPRSFDDLLTEPPAPDETGPGWPEGGSRLQVLAVRLWGPVLDACGVRR